MRFRRPSALFHSLSGLALLLLFAGSGLAATVNTSTLTTHKAKSRSVKETPRARKRMRGLAHARSVRRRTTAVARASAPRTNLSQTTATRTTARVRTPRRRVHRYYERFYTSSFATDTTFGDVTEGEDATVRQAAIDALGDMNGTVLAIEPTTGRILAMVNQKLALSSGAQPCSTIKLSVALAALNEGLITKDTPVALGGRSRMNLTEALAHSNNAYFESLGRKLGFEKVSFYAHEYGLGELAATTFRANSRESTRRKKFRPKRAASARCAPSAKAFR